MKAPKLLMVLVILCVAAGAFAQQGPGLSIFTGYAMTAFENQSDAAGTLPVGVRLSANLTSKIDIGAEFFYPIGGYTFETTYANAGEPSYKEKRTFELMFAGLMTKITPIKGNLAPYAKVGVGMYLGNGEIETEYVGLPDKEKNNFDMDSAIGFNVGGGFTLPFPLFIEYNYHIISRDYKNSEESLDMNFWDILVGYTLSL